MPYPRLIPCLDVADGRVVKCVRFENRRDVGDPVELAAAYSDGGADELVFLDIEATTKARPTMLDVVRCITNRIAIPFTVGGGLRSVDDAAAFLEAGADRIAVNSAAVADPALVTALARRFGSQAVVVAMDVRDGRVYTHAGTRRTTLDPIAWAREIEQRGGGEILLTSIDADGTRAGYDIPLTQSVIDAVDIPVIASGGAGTAQHVAEVLRTAPAALVASLVHDDPQQLSALRHSICCCGIALRPLTRETVDA